MIGGTPLVSPGATSAARIAASRLYTCSAAISDQPVLGVFIAAARSERGQCLPKFDVCVRSASPPKATVQQTSRQVG